MGNFGGGIAVRANPNIAPTNNMIGGTAAGAANTIAFNAIGNPTPQGGIQSNFDITTVLGNSIFSKFGKGIGGSGFPQPQLTGATSTTITGTFSFRANSTSRLEFFASPDTGGFFANAQGKTFLGAMDVTTDGNGSASFTFTPTGGVPAGQFLTATATATGFATSEFSTAFTPPAASGADLAVTVSDTPDPVAAGADITYAIVVTNNGPNAAQGASLTTAVPAGATFVSFTAPAGWTATTPAAGGTGAVSATAASLGAGSAGTAAFTLVVRVAPGTAGGTILNLSARVAATTADPAAANNSATVTTTVATTPPPNTAPTARPDTYATTAGFTLRVPARGVLGNDTDPENNVLTAVLATQPGHGTLTLNADGSFIYTPAAGFSGVDSFTYRASDGLLMSAPATVTLNVAAPPGVTAGPRVTGLRRFGFHTQPTRLMLTFDKGLAPAGASNLMNFRLVAAGRDGRFGTRDDLVIALRSATYDPISRTVSLFTRHPLLLRRPYHLTVRGGLTDLTGNALNGKGNGTPGSDTVIPFDQSALAGRSVIGATPRGPGPHRFRRSSRH